MTTTILAPIVTPILSWWLAGAWIDISLQAMMISIIQVVVVPIALGIIINKFFGDFVRKGYKIITSYFRNCYRFNRRWRSIC